MLSCVQVQKEAVKREYANMKYEQPYQTASYHNSLAHELRRWHYNEYEAVIDDLEVADLTVHLPCFPYHMQCC